MTAYAPCPNCDASWSPAVEVGTDGTESMRTRCHEAGCLGDGPVVPSAGLDAAEWPVGPWQGSDAEIGRLWALLDAPEVPDVEPALSGCGCARCIDKTGWPMGFPHMVVCGTCGNKRCPHAGDHRADCTNSNEWKPYGSKTNGVQP